MEQKNQHIKLTDRLTKLSKESLDRFNKINALKDEQKANLEIAISKGWSIDKIVDLGFTLDEVQEAISYKEKSLTANEPLNKDDSNSLKNDENATNSAYSHIDPISLDQATIDNSSPQTSGVDDVPAQENVGGNTTVENEGKETESQDTLNPQLTISETQKRAQEQEEQKKREREEIKRQALAYKDSQLKLQKEIKAIQDQIREKINEEANKAHPSTKSLKTEKINQQNNISKSDQLIAESNSLRKEKIGFLDFVKSKKIKNRLDELTILIPLTVEAEEEIKDKLYRDESAPLHIQNMMKLKSEYGVNKLLRDALSKKIAELRGSDAVTTVDNAKSKKQKEKEAVIINGIFKRLYNEREILEMKFEDESREQFPLAYFALQHIKDTITRRFFLKEGHPLRKNKKWFYLSLKNINNIDTVSDPVVNPLEHPEIFYFNPKDEQDNLIELNIYGFSIRMLHPIDSDRKGQIDLYNPNTKFKVIGPGGQILESNVDYDTAVKEYKQATLQYAQMVEKAYLANSTS